jgi:hypothetical protein
MRGVFDLMARLALLGRSVLCTKYACRGRHNGRGWIGHENSATQFWSPIKTDEGRIVYRGPTLAVPERSQAMREL